MEAWRHGRQQVVLRTPENSEDEIAETLMSQRRAAKERRAVGYFRCKLCPTARFRAWETYKRYCNSSEKRPPELPRMRQLPHLSGLGNLPLRGQEKVRGVVQHVARRGQRRSGRSTGSSRKPERRSKKWQGDQTPFLRHRK